MKPSIAFFYYSYITFGFCISCWFSRPFGFWTVWPLLLILFLKYCMPTFYLVLFLSIPLFLSFRDCFVVSPFLLLPEGPSMEMQGSDPCGAGALWHWSVTEEFRHQDVWLPWDSGSHMHWESESLCACAENLSYRCFIQPRVCTENQIPHMHQESEYTSTNNGSHWCSMPWACPKNQGPCTCAENHRHWSLVRTCTCWESVPACTPRIRVSACMPRSSGQAYTLRIRVSSLHRCRGQVGCTAELCWSEVLSCFTGHADPMPLWWASGEGNVLCNSQESAAGMSGVLVFVGR